MSRDARWFAIGIAAAAVWYPLVVLLVLHLVARMQ